MPNQTFIIVKAQFEGIHRYPDAPKGVEFLKHPHRHIFHVEAEIEVFHDDRELEFILVKRDLERTFTGNLDHKSCEMIAKEIQEYLKIKYFLPSEEFPHQSYRTVHVKVFEDGENGAYVKEV